MICKVLNRIENGFYFLRGWLRIYEVSDINPVSINSYTFSGYQPSNEEGMQFVYSTLNNTTLTGSRLKMFNSLGNKIMIIVNDVDNSNREVAINMYYLNPRDFKEKTIHEGFIGVLPEYEGKGIASQMRKMAIENFKNSGFKGISTRISKNNLGSLYSAEKLGFKPVEEYYDEAMGEQRYYLVCKF